jgi:RND family efflux transporter MFP subunit
MRSKRVLGVVMALVVVLGLVGIRARRASERASAPKLAAQPVTIEVSSVRRGRVEGRDAFLGEVVASEEAPLAARIVSQVVAVNVREGDRVHRGQVLVELDRREADDATASSEAALVAAREGRVAAQIAFDAQRLSTARDKTLADAEAISRDEWERSHAAEAAGRARLQAAEAQAATAAKALASAETRRDYATIRAPFDGVVSASFVSPGDLATPGKPLVTVVGSGGVRVRVKIPPERTATISAGSHVALHAPPAADLVLPIARVFPAMDASHLATIEIDPPATMRLLPGSTVPVDLLRHSDDGLLVPTEALLENQSGAHVFVVIGDRVRTVPVQIVDRGADAVLIRGDVREGDRVAVGTPARLAGLTSETRIVVDGPVVH